MSKSKNGREPGHPRTDDGHWDTIVVGQGLAGTTLAWALKDKGQKVLLIDADEAVTSSKIAAGLITPITGMRLVLSAGIEHFLPAARAFYQHIERVTKTEFFHDRVALRLFSSDAEQSNWAKRQNRPDYKAHLISPPPDPLLNPKFGAAALGGFAMRAAQLDVKAYLDASRIAFDYRKQKIDWKRDVAITPVGVSFRGEKAQRLISCEGYAATQNPYFAFVPFIAAKGEILTIRVPRPLPAQSLHRGIWLAPTSDPQIVRVGSTYDWQTLDKTPTQGARAEIESKLKSFFRLPFTVIDHHAAVRPIISQSKALVGLHPEHDRLGYFNGLGSKGSLHAPWFAQRFAEHLVHKTPLPSEIDLRKQV